MWRFEDTGFHSGEFNMRYDETLAQSVLREDAPPTVRVYGWDPPALSVGWSQSMQELELEKIAAEGVDVVRRPTGGRAIFHADELTYSVVLRAMGRNVMAVYDDISKALVCGLRRLGADARLEKRQVHFPTEYLKPSSAACFSSAARFEILIDGKKLVGSAQRRYATTEGEEIVLQHGSILLGERHKRIVEFLNVPEEERMRMKNDLDERTIELSSALCRRVDFYEAALAVRAGFEEAWGITFAESYSFLEEQ